MVAHSLAGAGAGGWSRRVQSVPSAAAAGARNGGGGVPVYGGIAYCQRIILERGFVDQ